MKNRVNFIIIFLLLILSVAQVRGAILLDRVVAIVDREIITWSELYRAMTMEYRPLMEGMKDSEKKAYLENIQNEFIDKLINMKLQTEEAKHAGFSVTDNEVDAAINDIRNQYKFTLQEFKKTLEKDGIQYNEYKSMLRDRILISKIVASEIRSKVIVTDDEISDYIEKNKDDLPLELSFKLFEVHLKNTGAGGDETTKALADKIYSRLGSGEKLEDFIKGIEKEYPGRIEYASGYFHASELKKDLLEALGKLEKGQVTAPIPAKNGIEILKIQEKELPVSPDILRNNIKELLLNTKSSELHRAWIKRLRQSAFIEIKL